MPCALVVSDGAAEQSYQGLPPALRLGGPGHHGPRVEIAPQRDGPASADFVGCVRRWAALIQIAVVVPLIALSQMSWRSSSSWVVTDDDAKNPRSFSSIGGMPIDELAVEKGTGTLLFTSGGRLYLAKSEADAPARIGQDTGKHQDPAFGAAGRILYSWMPAGAGSSGHSTGWYAQVFEFDRKTRANIQRTSSSGCHRYPVTGRGGSVTSIHATCRGRQTVDVVGPAQERSIYSNPNQQTELAGSGEPGVFVMVVSSSDEFEIVLIRDAAKVPTARTLLRSTGKAFRPQFGRNGDVYFQKNQEIIHLVGQQSVSVMNFAEAAL